MLFSIFGERPFILQKHIIQTRTFDKGVFETAVETSCAQALCPYPDTGEDTGAVCGAQHVSELSQGKANLEADLVSNEEIVKISM